MDFYATPWERQIVQIGDYCNLGDLVSLCNYLILLLSSYHFRLAVSQSVSDWKGE